MRLDRIAEDIYILVSDLYVQVTSTVLLTPDGAIVIDTMPFPSESRQILSFVEGELGPHSVRYVINTHHHADHTYGTFLFEGAEVISQDLCRQLLQRYGQATLDRAKQETPALAEVEIRLPDITFQESMHIRLSHRQLDLFHTPGHAPDDISVYVPSEKAVIASDAMMPVPYIVGGDYRQLQDSLVRIKELTPNFVVQGHGDVLLRGEVDETIDRNLAYLDKIVEKVQAVVQRGLPPQELRSIDIESCGLSRIPLDGLVNKLHQENLLALYKRFKQE
ncbi:MAG: MBL fold metallo-hydrolase [Chloroflexi bacterium]|jgi:cyclase|nr:MBL fold metallo-hydrolase [Chloroflexota bacterium]